MVMFDQIYERFKRFCTEWDSPKEEYIPPTITVTEKEDSGTSEIPTDHREEEGDEFPVTIDGYASSEPGTIKMGSYFTIDELCKSTRATILGISNKPSVTVQRNLQDLIDNILDPLRRAYGKPIIVNSGYRCTALNTAVGGVPNSQHLTGHAADITGGNKAENKKLWELIKKLDLPIDQCIDESSLSWVHVSYDKTRNRRMFLKL